MTNPDTITMAADLAKNIITSPITNNSTEGM